MMYMVSLGMPGLPAAYADAYRRVGGEVVPMTAELDSGKVAGEIRFARNQAKDGNHQV